MPGAPRSPLCAPARAPGSRPAPLSALLRRSTAGSPPAAPRSLPPKPVRLKYLRINSTPWSTLRRSRQSASRRPAPPDRRARASGASAPPAQRETGQRPAPARAAPGCTESNLSLPSRSGTPPRRCTGPARPHRTAGGIPVGSGRSPPPSAESLPAPPVGASPAPPAGARAGPGPPPAPSPGAARGRRPWRRRP